MVEENARTGAPERTKVVAESYRSESELKARAGEKVVFPIPNEEQLAVKHAAREHRIRQRMREEYEDL